MLHDTSLVIQVSLLHTRCVNMNII